MKLSFQTWLAQFKYLAKIRNYTLNYEDDTEDRLKFVYYDSGTSVEKAVQKEMGGEVY